MVDLIKENEVKVVFIGESGCGKSTLIRHLSLDPDGIKEASSSKGHAGTTKVTIEYLLGEYDTIQIDSVFCTIVSSRDPNFKFVGDTDFERFLSDISELERLDRTDENFEKSINDLAKKYLRSMSLEDVFSLINKPNTFFNRITISLPVNRELLHEMKENNIDILRLVDTRGIGDEDNIERVIPFAGADAIMIVGKATTPSPYILKGLTEICEKYKHIPVLFIGTHAMNEDEIDISSSDSIETYLTKLNDFNLSEDCQIRHLYADVFEKHLDVIEPVQKVMKECRINNVPYLKSLAMPGTKPSNYYKFYVPACIQTFSNCIKTISSYQIAQKDVSTRINTSKNSLYLALCDQHILDKVEKCLDPTPSSRYKWYVDFISVAKGVSQRSGSPVEYSYNCVAATLRTMLRLSINSTSFSTNAISNDILVFFFNRILEHHSYSWYWGYNNGYYYNNINFCEEIVRKCKMRLRQENLSLDQVVCTRHNKQYDRYKTIQILLYEECVRYLINKFDKDTEFNNYINNNVQAIPDLVTE